MYTFTMVGCTLFKLCHYKCAKAYVLEILGMSRLWHDLMAHGHMFIFPETFSDSSKFRIFRGCSSIVYNWHWHYSTYLSSRNNPSDHCLYLRAEIFHSLIQVSLISFP